MAHIYKEMMEWEDDYFRLCKKYGENPVYKRYLVDANGEHHLSLKAREQEEKQNELAAKDQSGPAGSS